VREGIVNDDIHSLIQLWWMMDHGTYTKSKRLPVYIVFYIEHNWMIDK
jgi:hypothetical protein